MKRCGGLGGAALEIRNGQDLQFLPGLPSGKKLQRFGRSLARKVLANLINLRERVDLPPTTPQVGLAAASLSSRLDGFCVIVGDIPSKEGLPDSDHSSKAASSTQQHRNPQTCTKIIFIDVITLFIRYL